MFFFIPFPIRISLSKTRRKTKQYERIAGEAEKDEMEPFRYDVFLKCLRFNILVRKF